MHQGSCISNKLLLSWKFESQLSSRRLRRYPNKNHTSTIREASVFATNYYDTQFLENPLDEKPNLEEALKNFLWVTKFYIDWIGTLEDKIIRFYLPFAEFGNLLSKRCFQCRS